MTREKGVLSGLKWRSEASEIEASEVVLEQKYSSFLNLSALEPRAHNLLWFI
jgi:hypothetical protein